MDKTIIYDNGNIKLEHLTNVQFRSKLNNKILTGKIIGQEATNFIVKISATYSAKISTNDILQVAVPCEDEEYFISLSEYKKMKKTRLTYQESCAIVNALSSSIENTKKDTTLSSKLKNQTIKHLTKILQKYTSLEKQILQLETN